MTRRRPYYYILDGHEVVPMDDLIAHGQWMLAHEEERRVARTFLGDGVYCVCTSFLGFDHNFEREGEPILFETMICDVRCGDWWDEQWRTTTWDRAQKQHADACECARRTLAAEAIAEVPRHGEAWRPETPVSPLPRHKHT